MTRKEAKARGISRYNTGKPCHQGHSASRYTASGACMDCIAGYAKQYTARTGVVRVTVEVAPENENIVRDLAHALNINTTEK